MVTTFLLLGTLLLGMFAGLPIVLAIGSATLMHLVDVGPRVLQIFVQRIFAGMTNYSFAAVPLFILAGGLMTGTGITERLLRFCNALVGHIRGSLAQVNIVASIFFAGISGSALADTAALGSVLIPAMEQDGYPKGFAGASPAVEATFAVYLYETSNAIELQYYALAGGARATGSNAAVGIEDAAGATGIQRVYKQAGGVTTTSGVRFVPQ